MNSIRKNILFLFIGLAFAGYVWTKLPKAKNELVSPPQSQATSTNTSLQNEQYSADGSVLLTLTFREIDTNSREVNLMVKNIKNNQNISILKTTVDSKTTYSIPENSWSPDNKQFFIKTISPKGEIFIVFKADGSSFPKSQQYLDINALWSSSKSSNRINVATGWAGNNLIVVYTVQEDGTTGPSYWFVTDTQRFLILSQ